MRQAVTRAKRNQAARSAVRTYVKNASAAVSGGSEGALEVVRLAVRALDKAAQKGIIHRNAAARRKSRLMTRLHQLSIAEPGAEQAVADKKPAKAVAKKTTGAKAAVAEKKPAAKKAPAKKPAAKKD